MTKESAQRHMPNAIRLAFFMCKQVMGSMYRPAKEMTTVRIDAAERCCAE